jgi:hypothetical protein
MMIFDPPPTFTLFITKALLLSLQNQRPLYDPDVVNERPQTHSESI